MRRRPFLAAIALPLAFPAGAQDARLRARDLIGDGVFTYDRANDSHLPRKRPFAGVAAPGLDGMRCAADGNLHAVATRGRTPSNAAFGGQDGRDVCRAVHNRGALDAFRSDRPDRECGRR